VATSKGNRPEGETWPANIAGRNRESFNQRCIDRQAEPARKTKRKVDLRVFFKATNSNNTEKF